MPALRFTLLDVPLAEPHANLRLDEDLLADGKSVVRLWESSRECVVLGNSGKPERDLHLEECRRAAIPVLSRCSGGGAVLLGPGCLNYSLVMPLSLYPECRDVRYSMKWILNRMIQALGLPELNCAGHSDLALNGRQVSGNAQRRTRDAILHHGTLLYGFDAARAELFLRAPVREPSYRKGRSHREFLGNLPLVPGEIRQRLLDAWCGA